MSNDGQVLRLTRPLAAAPYAPGGRAEPDKDQAAEKAQAEARRGIETAMRKLEQRQAELDELEAQLRARESRLDTQLTELGHLIEGVKQDKAQMLRTNEEEIISFSLRITEKVLQYEIENGRYRIGEVVRSTLRAVRDRGSIVVRVNPRDLDLTRKAVAKMGQTFGTARITCAPDESIPLASCCIETDSGKVFSEIPGRLERIERSLLKKNGNSDGV